ncbi:MAG: diphthine synthase, partial [Candidatus Bathyarchaeia archaeon]
MLGEVIFVGLGLHDEFGISLRGLEEVRDADAVFVELYTSLLPKFSKEHFEEISGKKLNVVSRRELEEENGKVIIEATKR